MEPHGLLAGQLSPGPLAQLANHGLAALSDATRAFARRAKALVRPRLFLNYRQSSSKCHFSSFACPRRWESPRWPRALNSDAAPLIFPSDTGAGSIKSGTACRHLGKGGSNREGPGRSRNLQIDLIVNVLVEPHFLHSSEKCSWPLLNRIGLTRAMAISSPQARHVAAAATSGGNLGAAT